METLPNPASPSGEKVHEPQHERPTSIEGGTSSHGFEKAPATAEQAPQPSHQVPQQAAQITTQYPALPTPPPQPAQPTTHAPLKDAPLTAGDDELIEQVWVQKAKKIVEETRSDPYRQEQEVSKLQADYLKKRYGKDIKLAEN